MSVRNLSDLAYCRWYFPKKGFIMDWTLRCVGFSVPEVCDFVDFSPNNVRVKCHNGVIGHAPYCSDAGRISIFQLAGLFVWKAAQQLHVEEERIAPIVLPLAAEAYIKFALDALHNGQWSHTGRPEGCATLWSRLKSERGRDMMIQKLGPNSVLPQRFAYFTQSDAVLSNKAVSGADAFTDSWIDAFAIAGLLKKTILGRPFCSMIAREVPGVVNKGAHPVLSG